MTTPVSQNYAARQTTPATKHRQWDRVGPARIAVSERYRPDGESTVETLPALSGGGQRQTEVVVDRNDALNPLAIEDALKRSGATLAPGLTDSEFDDLRARFGIDPAPDHRLLLSIALPLSEDNRWPDWRSGDDGDLRGRVDWPLDGILFDIEHNAFWHPDWPARPAELTTALQLAKDALSAVPRLAPIYSHRFLPTQPPLAGNPILSCYQTDIIYYGENLLDWFNREFHRHGAWVPPEVNRRLPFWSWFVEEEE